MGAREPVITALAGCWLSCCRAQGVPPVSPDPMSAIWPGPAREQNVCAGQRQINPARDRVGAAMTPGIGASDLRAGRAVGPGQLSGRPWAVRVNCRTLLALAVISFLVVACDGQPAAAPTPRPGTPSPAIPASRTPAAPSAVRAAVYQARASTIPTAMRRRMIGASWHPGCPLGLDQLRLLTLSYWGVRSRGAPGSTDRERVRGQGADRCFPAAVRGQVPDPADAGGRCVRRQR